jgi:DNA recombination protein RmuC
MEIVVGISVVALVLMGALLVMVASRGRTRPEAVDEAVRRAVEEARRSAADERDAAVRAAVDQLIRQNGEVIGRERERVGDELDGKKSLIDQQLDSMNAKLDQVSTLMQTLDANHGRSIGELSEQLTLQHEGVTSLMQTTQSLREALSSTKARGQWGERMADDVLQLAGFVENINYRKQRALENARGVPDFTFMLPNDLLLHMDVKFPLDNYLRYLDADCDTDRERFRKGFLRDARDRVRELAARGYREPDAAVDCVLMFIPNEALFGFIQEHDRGLVDEALQRKIVLCSPLTLFAVLAVVRQSVDNFQLERTSDQILTLLADFRTQWDKFVDEFDKLGTHLTRAQKTYDTLCTTRRRQLERPLDKLDEVRISRAEPELDPRHVAGLRAVSSGS